MKPLALTLVLTASVASAGDKTYTLADLKTLVGQHSYLEAVQHLADIAPGQRNAEWVDVAGTASAGLLATMPTDDGTALAMVDTIDRDYPQILKSAAYARARADFGLKAIAGCFRAREAECLPVAIRFADNSERKVALDAARLTVTNGYAADAIVMFKRVFDAKTGCSDKQLQRAIVAGIGTLAKSPTAADARALMTACWDAVKDDVVKAFDAAGKTSDVYANTCDTLKAKHLLSALQTKRCK